MCTHTCVQVMYNNGSSEVRFFPRASNPGASHLLGRVRSPWICRLQGETFRQRRNRFSMLFRQNHHWIQLIGKACLKPWLVSKTTIVLSICCQNQKHPEVWLSSVINRNNSQIAFPQFEQNAKLYTGPIGWFPRGSDAGQCWHHGSEYDPTIAGVMLHHLLLEWLF